MSLDRRRLVLVAANGSGKGAVHDIDLTALHRSHAAVAISRTTEDPAVSLAFEPGRANNASHLIDRQSPNPVSTYVIDRGLDQNRPDWNRGQGLRSGPGV